MKELTKKRLRELNVCNPHNLARVAGSKLYIGYSSAEHGRAAHYASWDVIGIDFKTDLNGPWYNYGHKSFSVGCREDKIPTLQEAMNWVREHYGITEWERDVFGSYQIKGTLANIVAILTTNIVLDSITKKFTQTNSKLF